MQIRIEEDLKNADSWLGRRKALARLLLQQLGWQELVNHNFVPRDLEKYHPDDSKFKDKKYQEELKKYDPEEIVLEAARYCSQKPLINILIDEKINAALKELTPERKQELENDYRKDLSEMKTFTAIMRKKITFLFLLTGYDKDFSEKIKYSEGSIYEIISKEVFEYCKQHGLESLVKKLIEKLINNLWKEKKGEEEKEKYLRIFKEEFKCQVDDEKELKCFWDKNKVFNEAYLKKGIRFLFAFYGWNENYLKDNGLLPGDFKY